MWSVSVHSRLSAITVFNLFNGRREHMLAAVFFSSHRAPRYPLIFQGLWPNAGLDNSSLVLDLAKTTEYKDFGVLCQIDLASLPVFVHIKNIKVYDDRHIKFQIE